VAAPFGDQPALGGRYQLGAQLGRGGVADVYRAHDLRLDRDVAVKIFRAHDGSSDEFARWRTEGRLLAPLRHPGLVAVYDAAEVADPAKGPDDPYLVMELVLGTTLAHELRNGPLLRNDAADLGVQLSDALAYIHRHGIVHRDVKPANVLLKADPTQPTVDTGRRSSPTSASHACWTNRGSRRRAR
jgi:serine/threonine protein kinase